MQRQSKKVQAFRVIHARTECAFLFRDVVGCDQDIFKLDRLQRMEFGQDPLDGVRTPTRSGADPDGSVEECEQRCRALSIGEKDAETRRFDPLCNP